MTTPSTKSAEALPELPPRDGDWAGDDWFTIDTLQAYGQACILADRTARAADPVQSVEEIAGVNMPRLLRNLEESSHNENSAELACRCDDCYAVIKALLAARPSAAVSVPDGETTTFDAQRLRRLVALAGLAPGSMPEDDSVLLSCLGTVLGMACHAIETRLAAACTSAAQVAVPEGHVLVTKSWRDMALRTSQQNFGAAIASIANPWEQAVLDACCVANVDFIEGEPRQNIERLISMHVQIALDPAVSAQAEPVSQSGAGEFCWSCKKPYTAEQRLDADGNCPHCNVEIELYEEDATPAAVTAPDLSAAGRDVLAERRRQVSAEGWTPQHDDNCTKYELPWAAVCYALTHNMTTPTNLPASWPWAGKWWKPTTERRNLIKAGALILAEIERLDRAALHSQSKGEAQ